MGKPGIEFTRDLNAIGTMALQAKNRDICESAYENAILSVKKKRHSKDAQLQLRGVLVSQVRAFADEKIYDELVMKRVKELLLLSDQIPDMYLKKQAYGCIAGLYACSEKLELSKQWYEKTIKIIPNRPKTAADKVLDLNAAINYCDVLAKLGQDPEARRHILSDKAQELEDLMKENPPPSWQTVGGFVMEANLLGSGIAKLSPGAKSTNAA